MDLFQLLAQLGDCLVLIIKVCPQFLNQSQSFNLTFCIRQLQSQTLATIFVESFFFLDHCDGHFIFDSHVFLSQGALRKCLFVLLGVHDSKESLGWLSRLQLLPTPLSAIHMLLSLLARQLEEALLVGVILGRGQHLDGLSVRV